MKSTLCLLCGLVAVAAGLLVWNSRRTPPVQELAERLETAWADNHTIV
jgi:hypothetical protein